MKSLLAQHFEFSDADYERFLQLGKLVRYQAGEVLLQAGQSVDTLWFIHSGGMRGYRLVDGKDITHHFFIDRWFATDYESYLKGTSGGLYIEALMDTEVYAFKRETLFAFFKEYPAFERIRYIQAEDAYLRTVARLQDFQTKDLKRRYLNLINQNPVLFRMVPQKHIASYLGVAPQSLSRIKESIREQ